MQQPSVSVDHHTASFDWPTRLRAALIHLGLSALVALLAALLVFGIWYPYPYREISGGRELFQLVVSVDVVLGPLITFFIFTHAKPWKVLRRDLLVVAALQLAGLAYGLWTVQVARPVHLVFETDRFRVVHQVDIPEGSERKAPAGVRVAPLAGPTLLAVRPYRDGHEKFETTLLAMGGVQPAYRPELWQPYEASRAQVLQEARPAAQLRQRFPRHAAAIDAVLQRTGRSLAGAAYLPLMGRKSDIWTVLVDARTAEVLGYVPVDPF